MNGPVRISMAHGIKTLGRKGKVEGFLFRR